jgi:hypothetical protein
MNRRDGMSYIAISPDPAGAGALDMPRVATAAALIGLIGTAVSLQGLPPFFLAASLPMSGLGLGLGLRQRNETATLVALTGFGLAALGLF